MMSQTVCGEMPRTAEAINVWASCNFTFLMWLVILTVAVLFIFGLLSIASMTRGVNRKL